MTENVKLSIEVKFDQDFLSEVNKMEDVTLANAQARDYFTKTAVILRNMMSLSSRREISEEESIKIETLANIGINRPVIVNPESINVAVTTFKGILF